MTTRDQTLQAAVRSLQVGGYDEAIALAAPLLARGAEDIDAQFVMGLALGAQGKFAQAVDHLALVVEARAELAHPRRELADALALAGRPAEAEPQFRAAIRLAPDDLTARCGLGRLLLDLRRPDEAAAEAEAALGLRPGHAPAHNLIGISLVDRGRLDDAIARFRLAAASDPTDASAFANLAVTFGTESRFDEALAAFEEALTRAPSDVTIQVNRAIALLKAGRLLEGWSAYEWRLRKPGREKLPARLQLPALANLDGIAGKTIAVHHEEGFGDTLQFLRYVPKLARAGARILLLVPDELARIGRSIEGVDQVLVGSVTLPPFDYHCPIISLPRVFGTTLGTIPAEIPYIRPDPALVAAWEGRLPPRTGNRRIGLVWSGEPRPYDPAAEALDQRRSIGLEALAPLGTVPGLDWFSLQKGAGAVGARRPPPGLTLHDPMGAVADFADTAAIIAHLDLVISVDTAVAHLAGAMGKPVFLLDRYDNCWRWLFGRTDSPWYPSLRIFRQKSPGDWGPVVEAVKAALAAGPRSPERS